MEQEQSAWNHSLSIQPSDPELVFTCDTLELSVLEERPQEQLRVTGVFVGKAPKEPDDALHSEP
ncbi:MAG: hypothetical protein QXW98_04290 [Candidatus Caldarchaeum sp.]